MKLVIGNKNYSSWSMRPWVLMRHFGIPFEEVRLRFDGFDAASDFKRRIGAISPAGRVPVLVLDDGFVVWDTLAIAETLAERFAQHALWPRDARNRARARSVTAEMHSGFEALRAACPQNLEASLTEVGARLLDERPDLVAELDRLGAMWGGLLAEHGGPFLFGEFGIADAFYAPVAGRVRTYGLPLPAEAAAYADRLLASPGPAAWIAGALAERDFLRSEEPYRTSPD